MTPANLECNNNRIFVVNSVIKNVDFLNEEQPLQKALKPKTRNFMQINWKKREKP
jgi:hypothetical protein